MPCAAAFMLVTGWIATQAQAQALPSKLREAGCCDSVGKIIEPACMLKRFVSNAGANVFSGVFATIYQLTITGIGGRVWQGTEFASWALALSIAAIAPIFAANLSGVITRRVVEVRHGDAHPSELAIIEAGRKLGHHLGLSAIVALICIGAWIQVNSLHQALRPSDFAFLLFTMLLTNSWLLFWQVRFGQYYADERNWIPALTLAVARVGGIFGMIIGLAVGQHDLLVTALGLCAGTWTGLACAIVLLPRPNSAKWPDHLLASAEIQAQYRANLRLLSGFAVGSVSMLVIQYSIPPLMALIAPERFNAFYLASALNIVAASVLAAATSALLAPLTRWRVSGDMASLQRATLLSPFVYSACCLVVLYCGWYLMEPVLGAMKIRAASVDDIRSFLAILGLQTVIRNAAAGYAMYIASSGTSRQMASPLLIEIALALTMAISLGWFYGENALLYGLAISGLLGSLYSSRVLASLSRDLHIAGWRAFFSLLGAQLLFSGLWWLIVRLEQ